MIRLDYKMPAHPKLLRAGTAARLLWLNALCYADEYRTGGLISMAELRHCVASDLPFLRIVDEASGIVRETTADELAARLVREGSLEPVEDFEGLFVLHDFHAYNQTQPPMPSKDDLAGWASARQARVTVAGFDDVDAPPAAAAPPKRRASSPAPPSAPRLAAPVNPKRAEAGRKGALKRWGNKSEATPTPPSPPSGHEASYRAGHAEGDSQTGSQGHSQGIASDGQRIASDGQGSGSLGSSSRLSDGETNDKTSPPFSENGSRSHSQAGHRGHSHGDSQSPDSQSPEGGNGSTFGRREPESGMRVRAARPSPPPSETGMPEAEQERLEREARECFGTLTGSERRAHDDREGFLLCGEKLIVRGYTFRERYDSNVQGMAQIAGHLDEAELRGQERLGALYSVCILAESWNAGAKKPRPFDPCVVADFLNAHPDKRPARILAERRANEERARREAERKANDAARRAEASARYAAEAEANRPPTSDELEQMADLCSDTDKAARYRERAREARAKEAQHKEYLAMLEASGIVFDKPGPRVRKVERTERAEGEAEPMRRAGGQ